MNSPYIWLSIFAENGHFDNGYFRQKFHMEGEFVQIRELALVIIFSIFTKNDNFGLKIKILHFLKIRPSAYSSSTLNFSIRGFLKFHTSDMYLYFQF